MHENDKVKLRFDEFDRLTDALGWDNDAERARQIGVSRSSISRMRAGEYAVSAQFIHRVLTTLKAPYASLFETVEDRQEVA